MKKTQSTKLILGLTAMLLSGELVLGDSHEKESDGLPKWTDAQLEVWKAVQSVDQRCV